MAKAAFECQACGSQYSKWQGNCTNCGEWNQMTEVVLERKKVGYAGSLSQVQSLNEIDTQVLPRTPSGLSELDRVLGGGIVSGSVMLIGGDPGIGKSTLLLQCLANLGAKEQVLYVTGEESLSQVALRAKRLGLKTNMRMASETQVEKIIRIAEIEKPKVMVIDSIQTMHTSEITSAPGGVSQVREVSAMLARFAKTSGTAIFIVGHVTKSGEVAGPRVLEHIVDSVMYLEAQTDGPYRILRSMKNRFGSVNELGIFAMTDEGMKVVKNPSAIFLNRHEELPGSSVLVSWEGTRPLLVECQALVDDSSAPNPRRVTVGLDHNRIGMLLAILSRHGGLQMHNMDVFANIVGGVRIQETSADLAIIMAIVSSLKNIVIPHDMVIFGEVGLAGEIRPVPNGQNRLREAAKHGFKQAIVPYDNTRNLKVDGMKLMGFKRLGDALGALSS